MLANTEQLRAISQMSKGEIGEIPFAVLLQALAVHKRSVVLSLERRQLKKDIVFENGVPVDCHSNLLQDTLGKFMVGRGEITEEQNQQTLAKSATTGRAFADLLVADALVNANDLYKVLQLNLAKKLLDLFTWRSGSFRLDAALPVVDSPLKVNAPQLVLTGISKFAPDDDIAATMENFGSKKFFINPRPPFPIKELRFSREHKEILGLVSLGKNVEELATEAKLPKDKVERYLYSLGIIGVAVPEEWLSMAGEKVEPVPDMDFGAPVEAEAQAGAVATAAAPAGSASAMSADEVVAFRNEIMEMYLRYRKLDAFDLLGIPPEATREITESAYLEFCEKYGPWKCKHPELQNLEEKARDLFLAGGRAFGELCNPETRNSIIARRGSRFGQQLSSEEARNAFAIKSNLLDAETQFKKGIGLMKQNKFAEAIEFLEFAHDCEPQNSTYRAELAYCRFRKDPVLEREKAIKDLEEAIRIDPECGLALYYVGLLHGQAERFDKAEPLLQRAIKLMAPDRRPIDALKKFKSGDKEKSKKRLFF